MQVSPIVWWGPALHRYKHMVTSDLKHSYSHACTHETRNALQFTAVCTQLQSECQVLTKRYFGLMGPAVPQLGSPLMTMGRSHTARTFGEHPARVFQVTALRYTSIRGSRTSHTWILPQCLCLVIFQVVPSFQIIVHIGVILTLQQYFTIVGTQQLVLWQVLHHKLPDLCHMPLPNACWSSSS